MFKVSFFIAIALAISSAQFLPPQVNVGVTGDFTINDLLGNYFLVGVYNSNQVSQTARCFKIQLRISSGNVVMTHSYFDTLYNFPISFDVNYLSFPAIPNELYSQVDTIYNYKNYAGQNDLIVRYYGKTDGKVILEKRDKSMAYVLSRNGVSSSDLADIKAKASSLGFSNQRFLVVDNNQCV